LDRANNNKGNDTGDKAAEGECFVTWEKVKF
jgi:hypothetical protein